MEPGPCALAMASRSGHIHPPSRREPHGALEFNGPHASSSREGRRSQPPGVLRSPAFISWRAWMWAQAGMNQMEPHLCEHVACSPGPVPPPRSQRPQPGPQEAVRLGGVCVAGGGGPQDSCEDKSPQPSQPAPHTLGNSHLAACSQPGKHPLFTGLSRWLLSSQPFTLPSPERCFKKQPGKERATGIFRKQS